MSGIKSLAKDTAIYGVSSIVGRFLNWCLVPLYTFCFPAEEYGVVTYVYSIVALAMVILTYGMETGFFRFANHERYGEEPMKVYSTSLISLGSTSTAFFLLVLLFLRPITGWMECGDHYSYVWMMAAAVALDAFTAIPFGYLRFAHRPMRFAGLKLLNIGLNIGLNLFFILLCPWIWKHWPQTISWFYDPTYGIGYIFLTNFITSVVNLLMLLPELRGFKWLFIKDLWRQMIVYSLPLLVLGVAGIMNQTIDKILLPKLVADKATALDQLGIYGANYKIAIIMVMFTQAFRFAYEPFIFAQSKEKGESRLQSYRDAMKWFVIFSLLIFLGVMFFIDIVKVIIAPSYWAGLDVVPIVMIAEFFFGVTFNLSLWYKLTDRTQWGMWLSLTGLGVTLLLNWLLVPRIGYMGCAWAALGCYSVMMVFSYIMGRLKYPIGYNVPRLGGYFLLAMGLYAAARWLPFDSMPLVRYALRIVMLAAFIGVVLRVERMKLSQLLPVGAIMARLRHR